MLDINKDVGELSDDSIKPGDISHSDRSISNQDNKKDKKGIGMGVTPDDPNYNNDESKKKKPVKKRKRKSKLRKKKDSVKDNESDAVNSNVAARNEEFKEDYVDFAKEKTADNANKNKDLMKVTP